MPKKPQHKTKLNNLERDLVEGFEGFLTDLRSADPIEKKYTCRRVTLDLGSRSYSPGRVKATRQLLNASQGLFAQFLGVSVKTVRAWESGKTPGDMASRFLDEIRRNPPYWRERLQQSIRVRTEPVR